jgi:predicted DsbA family dithiol-disulfide isomerase
VNVRQRRILRLPRAYTRTVIRVEPGTVVVYSDIACPWSHLAVHRLRTTRRRLGLDGRVVLVHRAFPLELINQEPTPKRVLDAEIPVVGGLDPGAGWQVWQAPEWEWPVTTLPALEAVRAAELQSPTAAEELDHLLRRALFAESRCISMRSVILEVARACAQVDAAALATCIDEGWTRRAIMDDLATARKHVEGSPHLFLADGSSALNPGVRVRWEGEHGRGFPVVEEDDPAVYEGLLRRAADPAGASVAG